MDDRLGVASPIYCALGPLASMVARVYGADQVRAVKAEHRAWREEWLARWQEGDPAAPPPPYADELDTFARPG